MQEQGLNEAVRAAGGGSELVRRIDLSQPPVSSREPLRPDLFDGCDRMNVVVDEVDAARAREYALLSALLMRAPDQDFLARLAGLRVDPSPLGIAHAGLAEAARTADVEQVGREFFNLFIGLGRGELMPYGSYYLTGFLHERPLARLRADLAELGIARAEDKYEPEDHIATLCEVMAGLAEAAFAAPAGADQRLFEKHVAPWAHRFFRDLEGAETAKFYRSVGTVGRTFIEIETEAFALPS